MMMMTRLQMMIEMINKRKKSLRRFILGIEKRWGEKMLRYQDLARYITRSRKVKAAVILFFQSLKYLRQFLSDDLYIWRIIEVFFKED